MMCKIPGETESPSPRGGFGGDSARPGRPSPAKGLPLAVPLWRAVPDYALPRSRPADVSAGHLGSATPVTGPPCLVQCHTSCPVGVVTPAPFLFVSLLELLRPSSALKSYTHSPSPLTPVAFRTTCLFYYASCHAICHHLPYLSPVLTLFEVSPRFCFPPYPAPAILRLALTSIPNLLIFPTDFLLFFLARNFHGATSGLLPGPDVYCPACSLPEAPQLAVRAEVPPLPIPLPALPVMTRLSLPSLPLHGRHWSLLALSDSPHLSRRWLRPRPRRLSWALSNPCPSSLKHLAPGAGVHTLSDNPSSWTVKKASKVPLGLNTTLGWSLPGRARVMCLPPSGAGSHTRTVLVIVEGGHSLSVVSEGFAAHHSRVWPAQGPPLLAAGGVPDFTSRRRSAGQRLRRRGLSTRRDALVWPPG